jgi:hypothetical protein
MTTTRASCKCSISLIHLNTDEVFHHDTILLNEKLLVTWIQRHGLSSYPDGSFIESNIREILSKKVVLPMLSDEQAVEQNAKLKESIHEHQRVFLQEEFTRNLMELQCGLTYFKVLLSFMLKSHAKLAIDCLVMAMTFCEEHFGVETYYMLFLKLFEQILFHPKPYKELVEFLNEYRGQSRVQHTITRLLQYSLPQR